MAQENVSSGHEHFREEDWLDFAREVGDQDHRARVAQHLEAGCSECEQTFRLWAAVLSVADQATQTGPPDSILRRMKDRFSAHRPPKLRERIAAQAALVFDSFRQPMLAGMRASSGTPARQLLYKAGRYTIKLQVEPGAGRERLSIVGQILDDHDPAGGLRDIAVLAHEGQQDTRPHDHEPTGRVPSGAGCHRQAPALRRRSRDRHVHRPASTADGERRAGGERKGGRGFRPRQKGEAAVEQRAPGRKGGFEMKRGSIVCAAMAVLLAAGVTPAAAQGSRTIVRIKSWLVGRTVIQAICAQLHCQVVRSLDGLPGETGPSSLFLVRNLPGAELARQLLPARHRLRRAGPSGRARLRRHLALDAGHRRRPRPALRIATPSPTSARIRGSPTSSSPRPTSSG